MVNNMSKHSKNDMPFIITTDSDTANQLKDMHFTLLSEDNGKYMFINNGTLKFDENGKEIKLNKMCYTNVMCMTQS